MEAVNYIEGNEFLSNIFIEIIKRGKVQVSIEDIINLEYNYLEVLDTNKNVLKNSIGNVISFVKTYEGYLSYDEEEKTINISNEEELLDILISERLANDSSKYKKAVKMLVNAEKRNKKHSYA